MAGKDDYFLDYNDQDEYFLKLIPDFSVFDLVEKYYIDNNTSEGTNNLFYYKNFGSDDTTISTEFYRAIFKIIGIIGLNKFDITPPEDYIVRHYIINGDLYLIVISNNSTIELSDSTFKEKTIIGVAF